MKRPILHITFWLVYLIQDTFLHFTWMGPSVKNIPESEQFLMAIQTAFAVLPPKLVIVFYFINIGVRKLLNDNKNWFALMTEMFSLLVLSIILFRVTFHYLVNPHIYHVQVKVPLFYARNILISILEMGYITGIAIAFKLLRLQTLSKMREQSLLKEKLETELKFLRNQTNPHFLFNTLNNIYALSRRKSDKTPEVVMKLSELLSFMLYETGKPTITLAEEIKMMEDYIDLEKIRYTEKLSIRVNKKIDNDLHPISPLLLLPLVENAFKHGISETRFDSFIEINILLTAGNLNFSIENTIENCEAKIGNGHIGLKNIKRQLELMYSEHQLTADKLEKTFKVSIMINLNSYGKI